MLGFISVVDNKEFISAKFLSAAAQILAILLISSPALIGRFAVEFHATPVRSWTIGRERCLDVIQRLSPLTEPYILLDRRLYVGVSVLNSSPILFLGQEGLSRFNRRMAFVILTFSSLLLLRWPNWLVRLVLVHRRQRPCRRPFVLCASNHLK